MLNLRYLLALILVPSSTFAAFNCSKTTKQYRRLGESVLLPFQAVTSIPSGGVVVNEINVTIPATYNRRKINVTYMNGILLKQSVCLDCRIIGDVKRGDISIAIDIDQIDGGTYVKTVNRVVADCIILYILGKPYPPSLTSDNVAIVGNNVTLTCESASATIPDSHDLKLQYEWKVDNRTLNDSRYTFSDSKNKLTIVNVQKDDGYKRFTCTAEEMIQNGYTSVSSDPYSLNVLYGPENMKFSPSNTTIEKTEGESIGNISCLASCNPPCTFKWTNLESNNVISNTAMLKLDHEEGVYRCTATRSGNITRTKDLTVRIICSPFSPTYLNILLGFNKPTFIWEKSSNCTYQQSFVIQTSALGSEEWINQTFINDTDTRHRLKEDVYIANITNILPGTYKARIYAYNERGYSQFTYLDHSFEINESQKDDQLTTKEAEYKGAAIGLSVGIVIITIYAVCVTSYHMLYRRHVHIKGSKAKEESGKQMTYVNLIFPQGEISFQADDPNENISQYTTLDSNKRDTGKTYDVLQQN